MKPCKRRCEAPTTEGPRCQAAALDGSRFCFFHDPAKAEERRAAQAMGGRQGKVKTLPDTAPDVNVENGQDVVRLISETINQVRRGEIDPRVANAVGYLANVLLKAAEQGDVEERLAALEAVVRNGRRETADDILAGVMAS